MVVRSRVLIMGLALVAALLLVMLSACSKPAPSPTPSPAPKPTTAAKPATTPAASPKPAASVAPSPAAKPATSPTPSAKPAAGEKWGGIKYARVMGAGVGSSSYNIAVLQAKCWTEKVPGITGSAIAGSTEKGLIGIEDGDIEMVYLSGVQERWIGTGTGPAPLNKVLKRVMFTNHGSATGGVGVYTRADSGIRTMEDIKKKKIAIYPEGTVAYYEAISILGAYGITPKTIGQLGGTLSYLSGDAMARGLEDKTIDVTMHGQSGYERYAGYISLEEVTGLRVISYAEKIPEIMKGEPSLVECYIPGGMYKANKEDIRTVKAGIGFACSDRLPADLVYEWMTQWYEPTYHAKVVQTLAWFAGDTIENGLVGYGGFIPLHPGAERFWKEKGVKPLKSEKIYPELMKIKK